MSTSERKEMRKDKLQKFESAKKCLREGSGDKESWHRLMKAEFQPDDVESRCGLHDPSIECMYPVKTNTARHL